MARKQFPFIYSVTKYSKLIKKWQWLLPITVLEVVLIFTCSKFDYIRSLGDTGIWKIWSLIIMCKSTIHYFMFLCDKAPFLKSLLNFLKTQTNTFCELDFLIYTKNNLCCFGQEWSLGWLFVSFWCWSFSFLLIFALMIIINSQWLLICRMHSFFCLSIHEAVVTVDVFLHFHYRLFTVNL